MAVKNQIGDIEISSGSFLIEGTGWLVGPRHLVTAQHVVLDEFGNLESNCHQRLSVPFCPNTLKVVKRVDKARSLVK